MTKKSTIFSIAAAILFSNLIFAQQDSSRSSLSKPSSGQIQTHKAKEIKPYKSKTIEVDKSKTIDVYRAKTIEANKAKDIDVHKGKTVEVYKGKTIDTDKKDPGKNNSARNNIEQLFGVWHTKIPGAVWQSPSEVSGYDKLHVSAGARSGDLVINKNGTYKWNSYGGKSGKWEKGGPDYPLVLIDKVEHKKWKVGFDNKHTGGRDIIIWDGYVWYDGKK
ncbi:MAG: hypothetical protein M1480_14475 [Bacteroidetes bacterium]|nr:hypothetical protein [Bacteroidota bacterium]